MRKSLFHISWVLLLGLSIPCLSQTSSKLGWFEVDYAKGCAPLTVTVTDLTADPTRQYLYDADTCVSSSPKYNPSLCPPTNTTTNTVYTYTQPGSYSLVQVVATGVPRADTLVIEVLAPQPPEFNITLCNNYGVAVNITDTHYDQFLIDYGDGSPPTPNLTHSYLPGSISYTITVSGYFNNGPVNCSNSSVTLTPVATLPAAVFSQLTVTNQARLNGSLEVAFTLNPNVAYELQGTANQTQGFPSSIPISGNNYSLSGIDVNTQDSVYCFRIAAIDPCGGNPVYSDTLCSTIIQVTPQEGQSQLNWTTIPINFNSYELTKNSTPLGPPITDSNSTTFTDTSVECDVDYCYRTTTVYLNGSRSLSVETCVTGINSLPPPAITSLTASVVDNSIVLDWAPQGLIDFYQVFRSENNEDFLPIGTGNTLPFIDQNLRPQLNTHCYYIIYHNTCGNQSPVSVTACAILLTSTNVSNMLFDLNWTQYLGWENGVSNYELEIMDEDGILVGPPISLGNTATSYQDPITRNRQISQYRIVAISNDSIPLRSYSNIVVEDIPLQVFVPNSFTPNNDGLNDTFQAKGLFINEYSMEIYSSWGELLFFTTDLEEGWSGIYKGSLIPEGTYVYNIKATDPKGRTLTKKGTVHLLRKFD